MKYADLHCLRIFFITFNSFHRSPGMYYIRMNPELTVEFDDFGEMIDLQEVETNS